MKIFYFNKFSDNTRKYFKQFILKYKDGVIYNFTYFQDWVDAVANIFILILSSILNMKLSFDYQYQLLI